jgi:hypothetical protein
MNVLMDRTMEEAGEDKVVVAPGWADAEPAEAAEEDASEQLQPLWKGRTQCQSMLGQK